MQLLQLCYEEKQIMASLNRIYDVSGIISDIFASDMAVISFTYDGKEHDALMQRNKFYHNGRVISTNEHWDNYVTIGMLVKFNAHSRSSVEYQYCDWSVTICWPLKSNLLDSISIKTGFMDISGRVIDINGRRGILEIFDSTRQPHKVLFTASHVYINEKKFNGNHLGEVLSFHDDMTLDAIPCFSDENECACEWFASIVYRGRRPNFVWNNDTNNNDRSHLNDCSYEFWKSVYNSSIIDNCSTDFQLSLLNSDFKAQCHEFIQQHINNPLTLFVSGKGIIMDTLNNEFGIMLGEVKKNCFQTIIFHRRNVFLYKVGLRSLNLSETICNGDRMKFIAVGAPSGFLTDWIAVQISVLENSLYQDSSLQNNSLTSICDLFN